MSTYEIKSTRHTGIGTLRMGMIVNLDDSLMKVRQALAPMLDSGVAVKLTDEEAEARRADVESLELPAHVHEDPDTADEVAELEARLAIAEEDKTAAETARDEAIARAETAEAERDDAIAGAENLDAEKAEAVARAEAAENQRAEAMQNLKDAEAALAKATGDKKK